MRTAYFDLVSGISGDMTVAALLDLGLPRRRLQEELGKLANLDFRIRVGRKTVHGIRAVRFQVLAGEEQPRRSWSDIRGLIEGSGLPAEVKSPRLGHLLQARRGGGEGPRSGAGGGSLPRGGGGGLHRGHRGRRHRHLFPGESTSSPVRPCPWAGA